VIPTRAVGRTSVTVSALGFGGAPIGNLYSEVSDGDAETAVAAALRAGIRYFDTAPHYGLGLSEKRLGAALAGVERSSYTISTKVGRVLVENEARCGSDLANGFAVPDDLRRVFDLTRDGVRRSVAESLQRLKLDFIDIALVHDPDEAVEQAVRQAIPALVELRDEGIVGAVGAGMNQWQALEQLVERTDLDLVMVAGRWTVLDRSALPLLETCRARSVAVLAAAPFNSGILASTDVPDVTTFDYGAAGTESVHAARRLAAICRRYGVELPSAALQFPLRHPAVAAVVCGMRTADEVRLDASRFTSQVPDEAWGELLAEPSAY
jgi:D-threo-aldose 1-dehydrogenase